MGRNPRLFSFPSYILKLASLLIGKKNEMDRLLGSLQIDSLHTRKVLNWVPPVSVEEGIRRMVQGT